MPVPLPLPGQLQPAPDREPRRADDTPPQARVDAAIHAALREPSSAGFVNAIQVYPFAQGALYRLFAAPERVTDLALQPGEQLIAIAAGDTARWTIGDTESGSGTSRRTHILVKPFAAGLSTNLVITTDRRSYHLLLDSTAETAMTAISWTYPADDLIALRRTAGAAAAAEPVAAGLAPENLRFDYRIDGDRPAWRPLRAFDDGHQVFIEFPADLATGEAPPLFLIGPNGEAELVNYRLRGRFYIVDRLFDAAELRLGERRQQIVRITRDSRRGGRR
ncbi:P-type conjugative transfer protein TrbG [Stakelama sp. CBK3Z-3]|uniref:P-type conjugative transfer protein TrbG n=2 Tax=Stakelama flava TaxID=2860338 RepID=A0ABS6XLM3_9SPHN|nr:P-type conjugative transfer protein TrbG [Stakelama flava]MBW4331113.1 P-type conjugative transfer protein TrbG [Stakelama flava]